MTYIMPFFSALIGGGVFAFIEFLIRRHDNRHDEIAVLKEKLDEIDKGQCRTQILLLIADYPNENAEIMKVAERYFSPTDKGGLGGDWYLTNLFNRWISDRQIGKPEWFNEKG